MSRGEESATRQCMDYRTENYSTESGICLDRESLLEAQTYKTDVHARGPSMIAASIFAWRRQRHMHCMAWLTNRSDCVCVHSTYARVSERCAPSRRTARTMM